MLYLIRRARHRNPTFDNGRPNIDNPSKTPQLEYDSSFIPTHEVAELDAGDKHMELDSRTFVELHPIYRKGGSGR